MRVLETVGGLRFAQPDGPGHGWVYWKSPRIGSRQSKDIRGRGRELCLRALFPHAHSAAIGHPERDQAKHKHRLGARGLLCRGSAMQCGPGSFVSAGPGMAQEHFPTSEYSCAVRCADRALSKRDMAHAVNKMKSDLARATSDNEVAKVTVSQRRSGVTRLPARTALRRERRRSGQVRSGQVPGYYSHNSAEVYSHVVRPLRNLEAE